MKRNKSIIPKQAQIPAAIVLALVFALLLWWQFGPKETPVENPDDTALVQEGVNAASLEQLKALLAETRRESWEVAIDRGARRPLERNPFRSASFVQPREVGLEVDLEGEVPEPEPEEEEPAGPTREEVLSLLRLKGTCIMAPWAMAVVNGRYIRVGDKVAGFVVTEVKEREIVLKDDMGYESLFIPPAFWFPDETEVEFERSMSKTGEPQL